MRNQLLLAFFFLAVAHTARAQCDAKQYALIYAEAQVLQEQGQFIEAKNKYEAAKIYACGAKDMEKADKAVDALFEQIDILRRQADKNNRSTHNLLKAFVAKETNPTLSIRMLEYNAQRHPDDQTASYNFQKMATDPVAPYSFIHNLFHGHQNGVNGVAWSPEGSLIASAGDDGNVLVWAVETGRIVFKMAEKRGRVNTVKFSPDGSKIAAGHEDKTMSLWSTKTGQLLGIFSGHYGGVRAIAFSKDQKVIASGDALGVIQLWNLENMQSIENFSMEMNTVREIAFSPDGKHLAVVGDQKSTFGSLVQWWCMSSRQIVRTFATRDLEIYTLAYAPDGQHLLMGGGNYGNYNVAQMWSIEANQILNTYNGHQKTVITVSFSPDGKYIVTGSEDQTARIWDVETGQVIKTLLGHQHSIESLSFSPDGKFLVTAGKDGAVIVWNLALKSQFMKEGDPTGYSISIDSLKKTIPFNRKIFPIDTIVEFDVETYEEKITLSVGNYAYSTDSSLIAIINHDHSFSLNTVQKSEASKTLKGHLDKVNSITFSPDNQYVVTGSDDNTVRIWSVKDGVPIKTFIGKAKIKHVGMSADGKYVVAMLDRFTDPILVWSVEKDCFECQIYQYPTAELRKEGLLLEPTDLVKLFELGERLTPSEIRLIGRQ